DRSHIHTVVLDLGLAGLESLGRLEDDRDLGPFAQDPGHGDPGADDRRHDWNDPDDGEPRAFLGKGSRLGDVRERGIAVRHVEPLWGLGPASLWWAAPRWVARGAPHSPGCSN